MIREITDLWPKIKPEISEEIKNSNQGNYETYEQLLLLLIKHLNKFIEKPFDKFNESHIEVVDFGDWQGTRIFVFHKDYYQPSIQDTYYTYVEYGSCSGCDTLLSINNNGISCGLPNERQLQDYLTLCLHLLQNIKTFT